MTLDDLTAAWEIDANIDANHLDEESLKTSKLHSKYIIHLVNSKTKLVKFNSDYNVTRGNKFKYYRGELTRDELKQLNWEQYKGVKCNKAELDELLASDVELNKIKAKIEYYEVMVFFLESVLTQIKSRDWHIKNAIEYKQFLSGN